MSSSKHPDEGEIGVLGGPRYLGMVVRPANSKRGICIRQDDGDIVLVDFDRAKALADAIMEIWKARDREA